MAEELIQLQHRFETGDGDDIGVVIPDEETFEAMRDALDDPIWLLGATWQILTTNDFKRGRFEDAFGAWLAREDTASALATLRQAGVEVTA